MQASPAAPDPTLAEPPPTSSASVVPERTSDLDAAPTADTADTADASARSPSDGAPAPGAAVGIAASNDAPLRAEAAARGGGDVPGLEHEQPQADAARAAGGAGPEGTFAPTAPVAAGTDPGEAPAHLRLVAPSESSTPGPPSAAETSASASPSLAEPAASPAGDGRSTDLWRDGPAMTARADATPLPARAIFRRTTEPAPPARPLADAVLAEAIYLTVVVPAYNEQERIADSLYRIKEYLRAQPYRSEIIVVDDGSADLTTEVVKTIDIYGQEIHEQAPGELLENIKNVGKGFSIARGLLKARGHIVLFTDADLSTPIEEIEKLLPHFEAGHSVVIGSRKAADAVVEKKPLLRRIMSKTLNLLVQALTVPGIQDTQCGFKAYKRETAHRLAILQRIYGFAFDMEHLYIARRLGLSIKEVGVRWEHRDGSKVHPIRDSYRMFRDMLKIRFYHRRLRPAKVS